MKNRARRGIGVIAAGAALALGATACGGEASGGGEGETFTLTYATFVGADHPTARAYQQWADLVEERSEGRVTFESHFDGSLCAAGEIASCVSSGTADFGFVIPGYEPASFPLSTFNAIGFITNDLQAPVDAFGDMYAESEEIRAEFEDQELHLVYSTASYPYLIASNKEVSDLDGLNGLSLRSSGDMSGPLSELGINPVSITIAESYESIERGVVDGISTALDGLVDAGLQEVTPYIYDIGEYSGNGMLHHMVANRGVWEGLSPEIQEIMATAGEEVGGSFFDEFDETEKHCEMLEEAGSEAFAIGPDAEGAKWAESAQKQQIDEWVGRAGAVNSDPKAIFDDYVQRIEAIEEEGAVTPVSRCID